MLVTRKTVDAGQTKDGVRCWSEGRVIWSDEGRCSVLVRRKGGVGHKEDGRCWSDEGRCSVLVRRKGYLARRKTADAGHKEDGRCWSE